MHSWCAWPFFVMRVRILEHSSGICWRYIGQQMPALACWNVFTLIPPAQSGIRRGFSVCRSRIAQGWFSRGLWYLPLQFLISSSQDLQIFCFLDFLILWCSDFQLSWAADILKVSGAFEFWYFSRLSLCICVWDTIIMCSGFLGAHMFVFLFTAVLNNSQSFMRFPKTSQHLLLPFSHQLPIRLAACDFTWF